MLKKRQKNISKYTCCSSALNFRLVQVDTSKYKVPKIYCFYHLPFLKKSFQFRLFLTSYALSELKIKATRLKILQRPKAPKILQQLLSNFEELKGFTLYFKNKKLSSNSTRVFNRVLDTINQYGTEPAKYFCPNSSSLSAIYDSFRSKVLKVVESKNRYHLYQVSFS